ncbi:hypothetical protein JCM8097_004672 [Rhodosporidiobolus ruineniae]
MPATQVSQVLSIDAESRRERPGDADRLAELGYEQELKRGWGLIENFGCSFSIIAIVSGVTTSFELGLTNGGPGTMTIGWICVSIMTMTVAFSMAEVVSAVPTSGGPYHWAALLSPRKYSAFAAYVTGYFNLLGQAAVTTAICFGTSNLVVTLGALHGFETTPARTLGVHTAIIVFSGLVNTFGIRLLGMLNRLSILCHSIGVFGLAVAVLAKAPTHRTAKEVFATFIDMTSTDGSATWSERASPAYTALTGILLTQYTITGFDASAHMSEETTDAGRSAPLGVITSVGASAVFGFFYLVALLFSIQDFDNTIDSPLGQPVLQIFVDVFGKTGATVAFTFVLVAVILCGTFSLTSNSRMYYSCSRDGILPAFFNHVDKRFQVPVRTVWLSVLFAFILALPSLGSSVAFTAVTSMATIGLYVSYAIPIAFLAFAPARFQSMKGPFTLGKLSRPMALIATLYVGFISVVFCLPTATPITDQTLNYTPVAVGIVLVYVSVSWVLWARKWFKGPSFPQSEPAAQDAASPIPAGSEPDKKTSFD